MRPYDAYMSLVREGRTKEAFDLGAIAEGVQHIAHNPVAHAGLGAFLGHVGANVVSNVKGAIPAARQALANAGARAGLHGKELNPMVERFSNNLLGPEFLGKEYWPAKQQAAKALEAAGGDRAQALEAMRTKAVDPHAQHIADLLGTHHTQEAIAKLPDTVAANAPSRLAYVDKDAPHLEARRRAADVASVLAAGKVDMGAAASVAWNKFKEVTFSNPQLRERLKNTPLDVSRASAHEIADGLMEGRRHPIERAWRKVMVSPESEALRDMGAKIGDRIPHPDLQGAPQRSMAAIERDPETHRQLYAAKERMATELRSERGRDITDKMLSNMGSLF